MSNLTIDINGNCNLGCKFCYQNLDGSILPIERILEIVDEHSELNYVEIGGGEPFLDKRLINIITELDSRGKHIHVSTNATVVPANLLNLEKLVREKTLVQVSLHASNPKLYKFITGRNFFEKVVKNIKTIKEHFPTVVSSTIYQDNFEDVENIIELISRIGLPLRINLAFGNKVNKLNSWKVDQLRGYLLKQRVLGREVDSPLIHKNNCYALSEFYGIRKKGDCPADLGKIYVAPNGKMSKCEFHGGKK